MGFDFSKFRILSFGQPLRLIELRNKQKEVEEKPGLSQNMQWEVVRKYRRWLYQQGEDLLLREKRILFWSLECDVDGAKPLILMPHELKQAFRWEFRYRMLQGLLTAYFSSYTKVSESWRHELGNILYSMLKSCKSNRSSAQYWQNDGLNLVSQDGVQKAAKFIQDWGDNKAAWDKLHISLQSSFIQRVAEERVASFVQQQTEEDIPLILQWLELPFISLETLQRCIDKILTPYMNREWGQSQSEKNLFLSFCVRYLEDPRLSKSIRWQPISADKREVVVRWLSVQDIHVFFSTVSMDFQRREFWMRYVPRITYSRIALSKSLLLDPPGGLEEFIKERRHAELTAQAECAFLIQIGQYIIVEFNRQGNACYIYHSRNLPFEIDAPRYSTTDLRNKPLAYDRLIHRGDWQEDFDRVINHL